jgi:putative hydrolases of HD superfamily
MPQWATKVFQGLTSKYEASQTAESQLAHDADKLETLIQAA